MCIALHFVIMYAIFPSDWSFYSQDFFTIGHYTIALKIEISLFPIKWLFWSHFNTAYKKVTKRGLWFFFGHLLALFIMFSCLRGEPCSSYTFQCPKLVQCPKHYFNMWKKHLQYKIILSLKFRIVNTSNNSQRHKKS